MGDSMWEGTLESFHDRVASTEPGPAGVAVAVVTARLGFALLIKVLEITARKREVGGLLESARRQAAALVPLADADVAAVRRGLGSRDPSARADMIEIPMQAARTAVAGLDLCADAAGMVSGLVAADLGAAALLLAGAVRAILICVEANVGSSGEYLPVESRDLAKRASAKEEAALRAIQASS
jgi:formiminotetrahydrofolate cyclodeaminase